MAVTPDPQMASVLVTRAITDGTVTGNTELRVLNIEQEGHLCKNKHITSRHVKAGQYSFSSMEQKNYGHCLLGSQSPYLDYQFKCVESLTGYRECAGAEPKRVCA